MPRSRRNSSGQRSLPDSSRSHHHTAVPCRCCVAAGGQAGRQTDSETDEQRPQILLLRRGAYCRIALDTAPMRVEPKLAMPRWQLEPTEPEPAPSLGAQALQRSSGRADMHSLWKLHSLHREA